MDEDLLGDPFELGRGVGEDLARDLGALVQNFLEERLPPVAQLLVDHGQDPRQLLSGVAGGLRTIADALEKHGPT